MTRKLSDDRKQPFIWAHLELDDTNLSPAEYRLYMHVVRRAGKNGECYSSVTNIAKHCQIGAGTCKRAFKRLLETGMISRESRPGRSSVYRITDVDQWDWGQLTLPGSSQTQVDEALSPAQKRPSPKTTQVASDPAPGSSQTQGWIISDPPPGSSQTHKVDPSETDPKKQIPLTSHPSEKEPDPIAQFNVNSANPESVPVGYQSAAERCNDSFKPNDRPWRKNDGVNGIDRNSGFVGYLAKHVLPRWELFENGATLGDAVQWIRKRENTERDVVQARYDDYLDWQSSGSPSPGKGLEPSAEQMARFERLAARHGQTLNKAG